RIVAVVQGIVRHRVLLDEAPHVLLVPAQERIYFHETELRIPLHHIRLGAVVGLIGANRADPGIVTDHGATEGQYLAIVTALIGPNRVQRTAVLLFIFLDGQLRANVFDLD